MTGTLRLFAAAALLLLNLPSTGFGEYAFVWANNPTASSYTPDTRYQYNSTGAINTIARVERGYYRVSMPNMQPRPGGNVQLSAYGSGSTFCNVGYWGSRVLAAPWIDLAPALFVHVYCFDASGNRADSRFTALYHDNGLGGESLAYLFASEPATRFYYTPAEYSYNSEYPEESPWIRREFPLPPPGPGLYEVGLQGWVPPIWLFETPVGNVQLTTYGNDPTRCQVQNNDYDGYGVVVVVACSTPDGALSNARFSLSYSRDRVLGSPATIGAYAHVVSYSSGLPRPTGTALIGSAFNAAGPLGVAARATRLDRGKFRVDFPRLAPLYSKSTVLVTADYPAFIFLAPEYSGVRNCKVASWAKLTYDVQVFVDCYDSNGVLEDSNFYVTMVTDARF